MALDQLTSSQSGKEQLINELELATEWAAVLGIHKSMSVGLTIAFYGIGSGTGTGNPLRFKGITLTTEQTFTMAASSTIYFEINPSTGVISQNTTGYTYLNIPLGIAVTNTTGLVSFIPEDRIFANRTQLLNKSIAGGATVTLTAAEAYCDILQLTGAITANINVVSPILVKQWTVFNNTTGAFTVTLKTPIGTGAVIATGKRAILYADGTNVVRVTSDL